MKLKKPIYLDFPGDINNEFEMLSVDFIHRTLDLYHTDSIAVQTSCWSDQKLYSKLKCINYPFTIENKIDYMTAAIAMLYTSQVSYLNARLLIRDQDLPSGVSLSDADFFEVRDAGDFIFTNVDVRFNRKVLNSDEFINIRSSIYGLRVLNNLVVSRFHCDIDNDGCNVSGILVLPYSMEG